MKIDQIEAAQRRRALLASFSLKEIVQHLLNHDDVYYDTSFHNGKSMHAFFIEKKDLRKERQDN